MSNIDSVLLRAGLLIGVLMFSGCGREVPSAGGGPASSSQPQTTSMPATGKAAGVLAGRVVCIDPGHQAAGDSTEEEMGPGSGMMKAKMAPGATGVASKVPEYKLTLAVSRKLKAVLEKAGAKVLMTRDTNDVKISNAERAKLANASGADLVIRIHADGTGDAKVRGVSVLYPAAKYLKDKKVVASSKRAAGEVLKELVAATGAHSRGITEREDMTGFNWSTRPVILVELGFMSNTEEDRLMETEAYQQKMVEGLCKGVESALSADGE